ncbi:DUF3857 domain-containing protein [Jiulongibacter sp. NS-SX5]|uniref:DUF3857 domain-containing protein n=1 Tax=Jiulongibacter sp. NS-SX5 TaxID=3463854 RepID=UPI0040588194
MSTKTTLLGIFFLLASLISTAQIKFGDITQEYFDKDYTYLDSTASSVVLYDYGKSEFIYSPSRGFEIETEYHVIKKILKESGLSEGSLTIEYYDKTRLDAENVFAVKGITYNMVDGKLKETKLGKKEVYIERGETYSSKKISLPDVKVGSIIEYTYTRQTPLSTYNKPRTWSFQTDEPVVWSEYNITIPSYFYYQIIFGGYIPLEVNEQETVNTSITGAGLNGKGLRYRFGVKDAPAFKNEAYITTASDYVSKVEFELSSISFPNQPVKDYNTTWDQLDNTLKNSDKWSEALNTNSFYNDEIEHIREMTDPMEKIIAVHDYMTDNYKWTESTGLFPQKTLRYTFKEKEGSATELNILANSILRSVGIKANPLILSTRSNGKINTVYPLMDKFNYTLSCINLDGKKILFDVTDPLLETGAIPAFCVNGTGREISEYGSEFVEITPTMGFYEFEEISASIDPEEGILSGNYSSTNTGYNARDLRASLKETSEEKYEEELTKSLSEWEISSFAVEEENDIAKPIKVGYSFQKEDVGIMPDMIYLSPLLSGQLKENPFKKKDRQFPVDIGHSTASMVKATYDIPEGFEVEELPQSTSIALPDKGGKFMFAVQELNNQIVVFSRINLNKTQYAAAEYPYLKEFYDRIVEKHAEQIVLARIEE